MLKRKRITAIVLYLTLLLTLCSCAGVKKDPTNNDTDIPGTADTQSKPAKPGNAGPISNGEMQFPDTDGPIDENAQRPGLSGGQANSSATGDATKAESQQGGQVGDQDSMLNIGLPEEQTSNATEAGKKFTSKSVKALSNVTLPTEVSSFKNLDYSAPVRTIVFEPGIDLTLYDGNYTICTISDPILSSMYETASASTSVKGFRMEFWEYADDTICLTSDVWLSEDPFTYNTNNNCQTLNIPRLSALHSFNIYDESAETGFDTLLGDGKYYCKVYTLTKDASGTTVATFLQQYPMSYWLIFNE